MFRRINDFVALWKSEEEFTLNVFSKISDENLTKKVNDNIRTLGRIAWHLTQTITEMNSKVGLFDEDFLEGKQIPNSMEEIISVYSKYSSQLLENLNAKWSDSDLSQKVELYGENWERGRILGMLVFHQIHHRAQMTVIMRLLDIPVPGIYGPSKEEWTNFGMEPQE